MTKPKIIVTRRWPAPVEAKLRKLFKVRLNTDDKPMSVAQLKAALGECDALLPTVTDRINAEVLNARPLRARIIGNFGVGFNHIDLEAAKACGMVVTNTPEVLTDATADLAMTLLLMVARRTGEGERHARAGKWSGWRPTHMLGTQVSGKTLGLVGMGRIAKAMAHRAYHGFGMSVIFHDPYPVDPRVAKSLGAESRDSVEAVLKEADFVSLHCPGGASTYHLLNARRLKMMKRGAFLINSARGDVIEEAALVEALRSGRIAGAGLDVYEFEPRIAKHLLKMENVVALPHLGSATTETRIAMGLRVLENVHAFFEGRPPRDRVV
ncbi:MAG: 2-hydroxyacid dehydrogenase [Burkholderiales bacterium]